MNVMIESPNIHLNSRVKDYVYNQLGKITRRLDANKLFARVYLKKERNNIYKATVSVSYRSLKFASSWTHHNIFEAVKTAFKKTNQQIQRKKQSRRSRSRRQHAHIHRTQIPPLISKTVEAKPMTQEEALLQLNVEKEREFIVYRDEGNFDLRVLYKTPKGDLVSLIPV